MTRRHRQLQALCRLRELRANVLLRAVQAGRSRVADCEAARARALAALDALRDERARCGVALQSETVVTAARLLQREQTRAWLAARIADQRSEVRVAGDALSKAREALSSVLSRYRAAVQRRDAAHTAFQREQAAAAHRQCLREDDIAAELALHRRAGARARK